MIAVPKTRTTENTTTPPTAGPIKQSARAEASSTVSRRNDILVQYYTPIRKKIPDRCRWLRCEKTFRIGVYCHNFRYRNLRPRVRSASSAGPSLPFIEKLMARYTATLAPMVRNSQTTSIQRETPTGQTHRQKSTTGTKLRLAARIRITLARSRRPPIRPVWRLKKKSNPRKFTVDEHEVARANPPWANHRMKRRLRRILRSIVATARRTGVLTSPSE